MADYIVNLVCLLVKLWRHFEEHQGTIESGVTNYFAPYIFNAPQSSLIILSFLTVLEDLYLLDLSLSLLWLLLLLLLLMLLMLKSLVF
jgi:hypothetical protein